VVNVTGTDLYPLAFIPNFLNELGWFTISVKQSRAGTLSVASTAISSSEVTVVVSGEVGRSAVFNRYNNGPRILAWYAHID
jgi:hypothetical protein